MAEIIWTEPALQELNDIAEYIALDNIAAARKLVEKVFNEVDRLKTFPKAGRTPPDLPNSVYREIIVTPCRIFYREEENKVLIIFVMREERLLRSFMLEGGDSSN
jgi:toxin ParE1/3/4